MPFNNLDYLYKNLPTRFQRADNNSFLKRFLQFFGETLDGFDGEFDTFSDQINSATANAEFIEFWLSAMFGWSYFPSWFELRDKRRLYANFAKHLARRGTARGIELWLAEFYISAKVYKSPVYWGGFAYGEIGLAVNEPLQLVIVIATLKPDNYRVELCVYGGFAYGESFYANAEPLFTQPEIENLLRFVQPIAQDFYISNTTAFGISN